MKFQSNSIWDTLIFLLNGLIFILIGLEFPVTVKSIDPDHNARYIRYGFIIKLVVLVLRTASVLI